MDAHLVDAPDGSIAPTSCAITNDAGSGLSLEPPRGSSDELRIANSSDVVSDVPGGACVGDHIVNPAAASLGIESDTGHLARLAENQLAPESGMLGIPQETALGTADPPSQLNPIHDEGGDQDDPNLNADTAGQEDPPEARYHRAGEVQIAPAYDTVLQLLVDLPTPEQNWIYPELETV